MNSIRIYSDESRHTKERFLLLGGIWVFEENMQRIESEMQMLRSACGYLNSQGQRVAFLGEFKWTKISDKYYGVYSRFVDLFFDWISKGLLRSCILIVDTHHPLITTQYDLKREGYFRLLYELYFYHSSIPAIYKIFPDRITNPTQHTVQFDLLQEQLEIAFRNKFQQMLGESELCHIEKFVNNITPIDSKQSTCIQAIDLIMGAVGYFQNGLCYDKSAKKAKVRMMLYILEKVMTYKVRAKIV